MQCLGDRPTSRLADAAPLICVQVLYLAPDLVEPGEVLDACLGDLALVGRVQFDELAPGVCQYPASMTPLASKALSSSRRKPASRADRPGSLSMLAGPAVGEVVDHVVRSLSIATGVSKSGSPTTRLTIGRPARFRSEARSAADPLGEGLMRCTRRLERGVAFALKQAERGASVQEVCRKMGVSGTPCAAQEVRRRRPLAVALPEPTHCSAQGGAGENCACRNAVSASTRGSRMRSSGICMRIQNSGIG